jgi:predicted PurR-regulated permease PerM
MQTNGLQEKLQVTLLVAAVLCLLFVMFLLQHLLNPLGYGLIIGILFYPLRNQPLAKAVLYASIYACGIWFLYDSGHLLIPFVVAYLIAFLFNPLVVRLEIYKIPRWLTAAVFTLVGLGGIATAFYAIIPRIYEQLMKANTLMSSAKYNQNGWADEIGLKDFLDSIGLDGNQLGPAVANHINDLIHGFYMDLSSLPITYIDRVGVVITIGFFVVLLPFLLFFMIRDYDRIRLFLKSFFIPKRARYDYTSEVSRIAGAYIRGLFIVVLISAFNLSVGFTIIGLPYGILLGLFAGLTNFIPTFGLWISIFLATILGISMGDPWYQYLPGIYIVFALEQVFESGFLVPRVMGRQVGIHPLLVMVSLLVFGFMFGFLGLLIAVPSVALLSVFYDKYKETGVLLFLSGADPDELHPDDQETQKSNP